MNMREILAYDPDTGIFTWINPPPNHMGLKGKPAGSVQRKRISIQVAGKKYAAHRLAWWFVHWKWPAMIDHINRDPHDNRIGNLRECDNTVNTQNHSRKANGSGLHVGVRKIKSGRFHSRIRCRGVTHYLGTFDTEREAALAYRVARIHMHGVLT